MAVCKVRHRARSGMGLRISSAALIAAASLNIIAATGAHAGNTAYTYDVLGRVVSVIYPDGSQVTYAYDAAGNRTQTGRTKGTLSPVANNDTVSTGYGTAVTFDPRTNDTDPYGLALSISAVGTLAHGSAVINSGTSITYTPTPGYYGADSFSYTISDGSETATATVSVTVATPAAPTANNVSLQSGYDGSGFSATLSAGGVATGYALASNPSHGSASVSGSTVTYTPTTGYYGNDSFTYTASGPGGTSGAATVSVTMSTLAAPSANNVSLQSSYNGSGSANLSASGTTTGYGLASNPTHGSASISGSTVTYTPTTNYYGADSFTYTATGPGGTGAAATVSVNVTNPAAPVANNASLTSTYNGSGSTTLSASGVASGYALATNPSHGSASISGTTATYTPTAGYYGADSFTYTASGPGGTGAPATVSVTVATPAAPTVGNVSLSSSYNGSGSTALSPSGVYSSLAVASGPAHGSASISGTTATYTPASGYYGSDSFTYTATGPGGTSSPATVGVTVATPAAPSVGGTSITTPYNMAGSGTISVSGVYSSTAISANPSHGSASISGTTVTYTPTSGYSGSDAFSVTASGPGGTSSPASVSVTVQPNPVVTINVTSASNLRTLANNAGYGGASGVQYQFVVPSGTTVEGASAGGQAIATGTWPSGVTLSLVVSGAVYGGGGNGGYGGASTVSGVGDPGGAGSAGGDAVYVQAPISIVVNGGGAIEAGGGGGGGGAANIYSSKVTGSGSACGGGGGFPDGVGGAAGGSGQKGGNGSTSGGGGSGVTCGNGGHGGAGGAAATAGTAGTTEGSNAGGTGGAAGYAIRFNGYSVGVSNSGTISGSQG